MMGGSAEECWEWVLRNARAGEVLGEVPYHIHTVHREVSYHIHTVHRDLSIEIRIRSIAIISSMPILRIISGSTR